MSPPTQAVPAALALELRDVRKSFGRTEIIRGANLAVRAGERVAVIGPNGAGKSTLFNLISGRFPSSSGKVDGASSSRRCAYSAALPRSTRSPLATTRSGCGSSAFSLVTARRSAAARSMPCGAAAPGAGRWKSEICATSIATGV